MKKKFDYLVYLGRFQPFHAGHYDTVQKALSMSENLIMVLGSHEKPTSYINPFTTNERVYIIKSALSSEELERVEFIPQHDHVYNEERWLASIQASVETLIFSHFAADPIKIGMVGYDKDHTSYYLKKFPNWELVEIAPFTDTVLLK
jgi:bifunctional NMN adenylyltransferase/nudix hydrolase